MNALLAGVMLACCIWSIRDKDALGAVVAGGLFLLNCWLALA